MQLLDIQLNHFWILIKLHTWISIQLSIILFIGVIKYFLAFFTIHFFNNPEYIKNRHILASTARWFLRSHDRMTQRNSQHRYNIIEVMYMILCSALMQSNIYLSYWWLCKKSPFMFSPFQKLKIRSWCLKHILNILEGAAATKNN